MNAANKPALRFLGAPGTVTWSRYLIEANGRRNPGRLRAATGLHAIEAGGEAEAGTAAASDRRDFGNGPDGSGEAPAIRWCSAMSGFSERVHAKRSFPWRICRGMRRWILARRSG